MIHSDISSVVWQAVYLKESGRELPSYKTESFPHLHEKRKPFYGAINQEMILTPNQSQHLLENDLTAQLGT